MLAHELRNPLAPITTAVHVLRLRGGNDPALQRAREVVERQVRQMARLVDDLLDVSRITRGKVELRKELVDLTELLAHAVQTSRPLIEERSHQLSVAVPLEQVRLEADATRLEQIITNLLNNAAKFTEPGGQIWLTADRERNEAVIRVRDTGRGIPAERLPQIFDLFMQVDPSIDRSQGGLGLGLTLVCRLVELHGGAVSVSSPGPGKGSEFVIRLPAVAEERPAEPEARLPSAAVPAERLRILVVDDNVDAADTLRDLLEMWGHAVRVVYDGPTALTAAKEFQPQVLLCDIGLPGMDGYAVAQHVSQAEGSVATLVALTGYGQEQDRQRSQQAGFTYHLVKPINIEELQQVLAETAAVRSGQCRSLPRER